jgi:RHS repeat-associated protein
VDRPDKPHAVTTAASGATYQYDASGNATRRGSSYLTFDSENRLLCEGPSAGCGSADVRFGYDLDGRRLWQKTATETVVLFEDLAEWDKTHADVALHVLAFGRRIASKSMTSPLRRLAPARLFGIELPGDPGWALLAVALGGGAWLLVLAVRDGVPGRIRRHPVPAAIALMAAGSLMLPPRAFAGGGGGGGTTVRRFLFHDHLGSNVLVTGPGGDVIHRRVFEPFGQVVAETTPTEATAQLFTGQRLEATSGLYDFRARWYDPEAGRFLSVDPILQDPHDPQFVNGYSYVRNRPTVAADPDGRFTSFNISMGGITLVYAVSGGEVSSKPTGFVGGNLGVINTPQYSSISIGGFSPWGVPGLEQRATPGGEDAYGAPTAPPVSPPSPPTNEPPADPDQQGQGLLGLLQTPVPDVDSQVRALNEGTSQLMRAVPIDKAYKALDPYTTVAFILFTGATLSLIGGGIMGAGVGTGNLLLFYLGLAIAGTGLYTGAQAVGIGRAAFSHH